MEATGKLLTKNPRTTMISIVYEYMIIRTTIYNFSATTCECSSISKDHSEKVVDSNIISNIILAYKNSSHEKNEIQFQK